MDAKQGRPGKDASLMIAALIIKHKLTLSDEETVLQIQEGIYLQYFAGFSSYKDEQPFAPSLFVEIRKRMGTEVLSSFEQIILEKVGERKTQPEEIPEDKGKMLVDATVCEQAIRYPTDMSLLNESWEISESVIDDLYKLSDLHKKPGVII